jgi:hypothetical protein
MTMPDKHFKDKLYDLETPLSDRVSFEKMMALRGQSAVKSYKKIYFMALGLLLLGGGTLAMYFNVFNRNSSISNSVVQTAADSKSDANNSVVVGNESTDNADKANIDNAVSSKTEVAADNKYSRNNSYINSEKHSINGHASDGSKNDATDTKTTPESTTIIPDVTDNTGSAIANESDSRKDFSALKGSKPKWRQKANAKSRNNIAGLRLNPYQPELNAAPKMLFEVNASTSGSSYKNFNDANPLSLRGNHHVAQYQALALLSAGRGWLFGAGAEYAAYLGQAEFKQRTFENVTNISSRQVAVIQPGLPIRYITVYDTTVSRQEKIATGNVSYRFSHMAIPLSFRYMMGEGAVLFRLSGSIAPGIMTYRTGNIFNATSYQSMEGMARNQFTMSGRVGFGAHYQATRHLAVIAEPVLNYRLISGNKDFNRLNYGFGFGLVFMP